MKKFEVGKVYDCGNDIGAYCVERTQKYATFYYCLEGYYYTTKKSEIFKNAKYEYAGEDIFKIEACNLDFDCLDKIDTIMKKTEILLCSNYYIFEEYFFEREYDSSFGYKVARTNHSKDFYVLVDPYSDRYIDILDEIEFKHLKIKPVKLEVSAESYDRLANIIEIIEEKGSVWK